MQHLQALIGYCINTHSSGLTPSDFPQAHLDQEDLDDLLAEFGE